MPEYGPNVSNVASTDVIDAQLPAGVTLADIPEEARRNVLKRAMYGIKDVAGELYGAQGQVLREAGGAARDLAKLHLSGADALKRWAGAPIDDPAQRARIFAEIKARKAPPQPPSAQGAAAPDVPLDTSMYTPVPVGPVRLSRDFLSNRPETATREELASYQESRPTVGLLGSRGEVLADYARGERLAPEKRGFGGPGNLQAMSPITTETRYHEPLPPSMISAEGLRGGQSGVSMMPGTDEQRRRIDIRKAAEEDALLQLQARHREALLTPQERAEMRARERERPEALALQIGMQVLGHPDEFMQRELEGVSIAYQNKNGRPMSEGEQREALAQARQKYQDTVIGLVKNIGAGQLNPNEMPPGQ